MRPSPRHANWPRPIAASAVDNAPRVAIARRSWRANQHTRTLPSFAASTLGRGQTLLHFGSGRGLGNRFLVARFPLASASSNILIVRRHAGIFRALERDPIADCPPRSVHAASAPPLGIPSNSAFELLHELSVSSGNEHPAYCPYLKNAWSYVRPASVPHSKYHAALVYPRAVRYPTQRQYRPVPHRPKRCVSPSGLHGASVKPGELALRTLSPLLRLGRPRPPGRSFPYCLPVANDKVGGFFESWREHAHDRIDRPLQPASSLRRRYSWC